MSANEALLVERSQTRVTDVDLSIVSIENSKVTSEASGRLHSCLEPAVVDRYTRIEATLQCCLQVVRCAPLLIFPKCAAGWMRVEPCVAGSDHSHCFNCGDWYCWIPELGACEKQVSGGNELEQGDTFYY
jgi:hypothetical protein